MKVVYQKTVLTTIREARRDALMERKEIEHIELTLQEARRLLDECGRAQPVFGEMECWYSEFERWLFRAELHANIRSDVHVGPQPGLRVLGIEIKVSR